MPSFVEEKKFLISDIKDFILGFLYLLHACFWVFFFKQELFKDYSGNSNIWFLVPPTNRASLINELKESQQSIKNPDIVTWRKKFNGLNLLKNLKRIFYFIKLIKKSKLNFLSLQKNIQLNLIIYKSIDLFYYISAIKELPISVFSQKDFQRYENAIIQILNSLNVPTFTSQHTVHHIFSKNNERAQKIMITNNVSKNILCWGSFNKSLYKKYNIKSNIYEIKAHLRPRINKNKFNNSDKKKLLLALGCDRRMQENINILKIIKSAISGIKNYKIIIRPHPTADNIFIRKLLDNLGFEQNIEISDGAKKHSFDYDLNTICLTGLSGTYWDLIYLNYKVMFFDNEYKLEQKLPRCMSPIKTSNDLIDQINSLEKLSNEEWKNISNTILPQCIGMKALEVRNTSLIDDIYKIVYKN